MKTHTLRFQIYSALALTVLLIAVVFSLILYPFENQRRQAVTDKIELFLNTIVEQKEETLANELFLSHRESISILLGKMMTIEDMIGIGIYGKEGELIVDATSKVHSGIDAQGWLSAPLTREVRQTASDRYVFTQERPDHHDVVTYTRAIKAIGETLGYLKVYYSISGVVRDTRMAVLFFTALLVAILLSMTLLLNILLSRFVIRPASALMKAMQKVQQGHLGEQVDLPSSNEIGQMAATFNRMSSENARMYHELEDLNRNLEQRVEERTMQLHQSLMEIEEANKKIMDSIRYAKVIQDSLMPDVQEVQCYLPQSFFMWMPRDILAGDIFFVDVVEGGLVAAVLDCTGHGVPGAFMTMLVSSALRRTIRDEKCKDPAQILCRLNLIVKTTLHQDKDYTVSDDGLDAAVCFIDHTENVLTFAGARLPLFCVAGGRTRIIKGDRQSIGYKRSDVHHVFQRHRIEIREGMSFYMASDGFEEQLGGARGFSFGRTRFGELLQEVSSVSLERQKDIIMEVFDRYRGEHERQDDVTVIGFRF